MAASITRFLLNGPYGMQPELGQLECDDQCVAADDRELQQPQPAPPAQNKVPMPTSRSSTAAPYNITGASAPEMPTRASSS